MGDRLLAVNERSVALGGTDGDGAMELLQRGPLPEGSRVVLLTELEVLESVVPASGVFTVRLMKRAAQGLGLTIAGSYLYIPTYTLYMHQSCLMFTHS